jgi:hypothetical protein
LGRRAKRELIPCPPPHKFEVFQGSETVSCSVHRMRVCKKCGVQSLGGQFCGECGTGLANSSEIAEIAEIEPSTGNSASALAKGQPRRLMVLGGVTAAVVVALLVVGVLTWAGSRVVGGPVLLQVDDEAGPDNRIVGTLSVRFISADVGEWEAKQTGPTAADSEEMPTLGSWQSDRPITIHYLSSYGEDQPLTYQFSPSDLALNGFSDGTELRIMVKLSDDRVEILATAGGRDILLGSAVRGNEAAAVVDCNTKSADYFEAKYATSIGMSDLYATALVQSGLGDADGKTISQSNSLSEWATRADDVGRTVESHVAEATEPLFDLLGVVDVTPATDLLASWKSLGEAWIGLGDLAYQYQDSDVPQAAWEAAWQEVYSAEIGPSGLLRASEATARGIVIDLRKDFCKEAHQ